MKKKDIKLLSEAIEKNFFETYNKIKRNGEVILSERTLNEMPMSPDDEPDIEWEVTLKYGNSQPVDENDIDEVLDSIQLDFHRMGVPAPYYCYPYITTLASILGNYDSSRIEPLKSNLIKASAWLSKNAAGKVGVDEGAVYDWIYEHFESEIDEAGSGAHYECYKDEPDY